MPLYFAYGSNMQSATLRGRRGIDYRSAIPARAVGWKVVLNKPALIGKSGFANLIEESGSFAFGVVFDVSEDDLAHIELTEGVIIGNYRRVIVAVQPLGDAYADTLTAFSLSSDRMDPQARPSARYMRLLIDGAREHGLPADYIDHLTSVVPSLEEHPEEALLRPLMDDFMKRRG
jgi:gamma-glutamylcyclotransferase